MIIYSRQKRWTPRHWAAVGAAASLSLSLTWWFSDAGPGGRRAADDGVRAVAVHAPAARAAGGGPVGAVKADETPRAPAQPPAMPFRYVSHWMDNGTPVAVLASGTQQFVVRVPGLVGAGYELLSVDDRQAVLRYLPLGTLESVARTTGAAADGTVAAPAVPAVPPPPAPSSDPLEPDN
jgi:hypothetical protein